jgi:hypothetical protein|tara:strand:- start:488 stop:1174 length:687 start_codon:yes stop_codon:yes gene_type:complete
MRIANGGDLIYYVNNKEKNYIMKNIFTAFLLMLSTTAFADLSGSATITNDYVWRGMTQGAENALQVGVDYNNDNGFYAGVWTSDVDFGGDVDREVDLYAGWSGALVDGVLDVTVGYIKYDYQGEEFDFEEYLVGFSSNGFTVNYYDTVDSDTYTVEAIYAVPFITVVDVELIGYEIGGEGTEVFGQFQDSVGLRLTKELNDRFSVGFNVGQDLVADSNYYAFSVSASL